MSTSDEEKKNAIEALHTAVKRCVQASVKATDDSVLRYMLMSFFKSGNESVPGYVVYDEITRFDLAEWQKLVDLAREKLQERDIEDLKIARSALADGERVFRDLMKRTGFDLSAEYKAIMRGLQRISFVLDRLGHGYVFPARDVSVALERQVFENRNDYEKLSELIPRLQAILASEGDLPVTVWDSDHSDWYEDRERIWLDVVDNTDWLDDEIKETLEKIPFSRFLGIR